MTGNENVDTATNLVKSKVEELKKVREEAVKVIRENFKDLFIEFFEKHPAVECVSWTQYTPYFMDGDPCVFSVNNFGYRTFEDSVWGECVTGRHYDYDSRKWVEGLSPDELALGYTMEMCKDWLALSDSLREIPDEIYKDLFGDHSQVTVTRDGITVDEYEHD